MKSTDTQAGWYPTADPIGIPDTNYAVGNDGPLAAVLHIVDGSFLSCISEFTASKRKSSHFLIGKNGAVKQFVSVRDTAYANGLSWSTSRQCWIDPDGNALIGAHKPLWSLLKPPRNPNYYTVSVEREGHPADTPTTAMDDATIALLDWLGRQFPALRPYKALVNLVGHRHIGPVHRANCPGPHVDFEVLAKRANAPVPLPDTPALPDPLKAERLPAPGGKTFACSERVAGFYAVKGGAAFLGLALTDETRATGADGRICSYVRCERVVIKSALPEGPHLALLDEAIKQRWI